MAGYCLFSFKWYWLCFDKQATCFSTWSYPDPSLDFSLPPVILFHCRDCSTLLLRHPIWTSPNTLGDHSAPGWMANGLEVPYSVNLASPWQGCVLVCWNLYPMRAQPNSRQRLKVCLRRWVELHFFVVYSPSEGTLFNFQAPQLPASFSVYPLYLGCVPSCISVWKLSVWTNQRLVVEPTVSFLATKHRSHEHFYPIPMNSCPQNLSHFLVACGRKAIWFLWLIPKKNKTRECLKIWTQTGLAKH